MPLSRIPLYGNPNIGAFTFATDKFALFPPDMPAGAAREFSETLGVPCYTATVSGSVLLGIFLLGNSKGIIVPDSSTEEEISVIRECTRVPIAIYDGKKNALGNMVLANEKHALVGLDIDPLLKDLIAETLKVEVHEGTIATLNMPGVCAIANGRGIVAHPMTTEEELAKLSEIFNIPVDISTVNCGFPYLKVGITANSNGAVVGEATTGPEMARIESSLGITGTDQGD